MTAKVEAAGQRVAAATRSKTVGAEICGTAVPRRGWDGI